MNVSTTFANQIHPLTGLHQSTWAGVIRTPSRDEVRQKQIIAALREHGGCAKHRIVNIIHVTPDRVEKNLDSLIAQGVVGIKTGPGMDGRKNKKLYYLKGTA